MEDQVVRDENDAYIIVKNNQQFSLTPDKIFDLLKSKFPSDFSDEDLL